MAAGLQTHIWNNNLKSMAMLAGYPALVLLLVWLCLGAMGVMLYGTAEVEQYNISFAGQGRDFSRELNTSTISALRFANGWFADIWLIVIGVVTAWFGVAYLFHTKMVRKLSHSHPVTRKQEPALYNLLENLSITAGIPMPRLEIIETHARNAFASGIDQKSYTVTVTRGLMNSLTKDELEAVLAHELAHILNGDVRLLIITIIFTGMIGFAAQLVWNNIRYSFMFSSGRGRKNGGGAAIMLVIALILGIGYLITLLSRFAISRKREYMADAGAVQLTKNPEAMMSALMRIAGRAEIPAAGDDIAMMCFENKKRFLGMFATHPPIEKRIQSLAETTNTKVPQLSLPPAPSEKRFQSKPPNKNPWISRTRRGI